MKKKNISKPESAQISNLCDGKIMFNKTSELPKETKFIIKGWGSGIILFIQNLGDKVRVFINGCNDSLLEALNHIPPSDLCKLKNELLIRNKAHNPIIHLVSDSTSKKFIFIYSIDAKHASIDSVLSSAQHNEEIINKMIADQFDLTLESLRNRLKLPKMKKDIELVGSSRSMILPGKKVGEFVVLDSEGNSKRCMKEKK